MATPTITKVTQTYENESIECAKLIFTEPGSYKFAQIVSAETDYIFQFVCKSESATTLTIQVGDTVKTQAITTDFARYVIPFPNTTNDNTSLYITFPAGTYYLFNLQLERATTASAWRPAPEDAEDYADEASRKAVEAQTQLDVFNKLTNNGQEQGIYLQNGKIYINGEYIDVTNLVVRILQSYADNNRTFLESEAGYLDIRRYNNSAARWEQRVGIYRNTVDDRGEIRLSLGDVNENGDFIPGGAAVKSIFTPNILQLGYTRMVDGYIDPTSYTGHINAGTIRGYKGLQGGDGTQSGKLKLSIVQPGGTFSDYYVEPIAVKAADGKSVLAIAQDSENYITGLTTLSSTQISNVGASVTFDMKGYSAILIQINAEGVSGRSHFEIFPAGNYTGYFRFHQGTNWIQTQIERTDTSVTIYIRDKSNTNGNIGVIYGIR